MSKQTLIYISVTTYDHPNMVSWFPVQAIQEHENCYRIIEESFDPEHEYWQFSSNEIVRCEKHKFAENEFGLTSVEKCSH